MNPKSEFGQRGPSKLGAWAKALIVFIAGAGITAFAWKAIESGRHNAQEPSGEVEEAWLPHGPLFGAVFRNEPAEVRRLVKNRECLRERDPVYLGTALMATVYETDGRDTEIAEVLLDAGMPINAADFQGYTALMRAVIFDNVPHVRLLLQRGADVNHRSKDGRRALDHAVWQDKTGEVTQVLLESGADPHAPAFKGESAWEYAQFLKREGVRVASIAVLEKWLAAHPERPQGTAKEK